MKKRLTVEELVVRFNKLRMANFGKTFTAEECDNLLKQEGKFNSNLAYEIKRALFKVSRKNGRKIFEFEDQPIYKKRMEAILESYRKSLKPSSFNEESLIRRLQNKGYQISKPIGFDQERFAKENPELYKKYLIYESV